MTSNVTPRLSITVLLLIPKSIEKGQAKAQNEQVRVFVGERPEINLVGQSKKTWNKKAHTHIPHISCESVLVSPGHFVRRNR
jgi:hypothetical protein